MSLVAWKLVGAFLVAAVACGAIIWVIHGIVKACEWLQRRDGD